MQPIDQYILARTAELVKKICGIKPMLRRNFNFTAFITR